MRWDPPLWKARELERLVAEEHAHEVTRRDVHRRGARRYNGVAWSGMAPDPWPERSREKLQSDAAARLAELVAWRASAEGRLIAAVTAAQQAASRAHTAGDAVRAAVNRNFESERDVCVAAAAAVEREGRRLVTAARAARRALRNAD